jgi:hypothetical protein
MWLEFLERRPKHKWPTHVTHDACWHAPHALTRLYTTVLHLHRSPLSDPLGPWYEFPGFKAEISNAAHGNKIARDMPKVHIILTAVITCPCQVRCDQAGALLKRIECLSIHHEDAKSGLLSTPNWRLTEWNQPKKRYRRYNSWR